MSEPAIAREHIDLDAQKVIRHLVRNGYQAYLVGGCVRDLLLGRTPKDFDLATSAIAFGKANFRRRMMAVTSSIVPGATNMGHTEGWCHTTDMEDPPQCTDATRNAQMNAQAAR